jgi:hypothetical protein
MHRNLYFTLRLCLAVFFTIFLVTMGKNFLTSPFFSSGTSNLVNTLSSSSKSNLIKDSKKLNELIGMVKENENNDQGKRYGDQSKIHRQEIAKIYLRMAETVNSNLTDMAFNSHHKMIPDAKEMVFGLQESATVASRTGTNLSEFHPQSVGFLSLGNSEITNAMNIEAKKKILSKSKQLNDLVKIDSINKEKNSLTKEYTLNPSIITGRQKISELYAELAGIMSDDLRTIQINNPRATPTVRIMIQGLQQLVIESRRIDFNLSEFHPENISYKELVIK